MYLSIIILWKLRKFIQYFLVLCERREFKKNKEKQLNEFLGKNKEKVLESWAVENSKRQKK